jgi:hypothetical protein
VSGMARRQSTGRSQLRVFEDSSRNDNNDDNNDSRPFAEEPETRSTTVVLVLLGIFFVSDCEIVW